MNDYDSEFIELLEDDENDEPMESDDERSRFRPFRPKVPSGKGLFKGRTENKYVSQIQLQAALARVGGQIKATGDATKAVSTRVNTLGSDVIKTRKAVGAVKKDVANGRMMSILPLLLTQQPKLKKLTLGSDGTVTSQEFEKQDNLLPLILLMGMGNSSGGDGKSDDSMNMMLPLILIMSQDKK